MKPITTPQPLPSRQECPKCGAQALLSYSGDTAVYVCRKCGAWCPPRKPEDKRQMTLDFGV